MFSFFRFLSPLRAIRDLRAFMGQRRKHELWFMAASVAVTTLIIVAFAHDAHVTPPYQPPTIIYAKSWPLNRTEAQILADQKKSMAEKKVEDAKLAKLRKKNQEEFEALNNKLAPWL
ncbi:hypothetical protein GCM10023219_13630 [Stakelama sediminis]|uniref:Uncharacterized protein n=1 Tax=Stakelama sediminis TaxID=463200 RepID=A0A840YWQ4_9SPHN|nr:hypothetical protein [Stakelama sediminis]MBB5718088.1 hypothetical protein [Stakelama sediminis]